METFVRDDSEDIYIGADPEPYLFEPEYTEDGSCLGGDCFQALWYHGTAAKFLDYYAGMRV